MEIREEPIGVEDDLPDAHLFWLEVFLAGLEEIDHFLEDGQAPEGMSTKKKQILAMKAASYSLINGFLYKMGLDDILRRCVLEHERDKPGRPDRISKRLRRGSPLIQHLEAQLKIK